MAHALQDRFSALVMAKLRKELKLGDGIVFNNDYEGDPKAGAVKIPVRDTEVTAQDYDKAQGVTPGTGTTTYATLTINKDKAVDEIIDGYDAEAVPDNIVAERLDSAAYSLAAAMDNDGATILISEGTADNVAVLSVSNAYDTIVAIRTKLSKANVPDDGRRFLLVTPDFYAMLLKDKDHFVAPSDMGAQVVATGAIGKIAGFNVYEWNDNTANLAFIAGHPKFATRVKEFTVAPKIVSLDGDAAYVGASAVKGRMVYAHKVLRSSAVRPCFAPTNLAMTAAQGANAGGTVLTVTAGADGTTFAYKKNPTERVAFGTSSSDYAGTSLTSGTTEIASCVAGDVIEVVNLKSSAVVGVGYITLEAADIK